MKEENKVVLIAFACILNLFPMMYVGLIPNVEVPSEWELLRTGYIWSSLGVLIIGMSVMIGYALNEIVSNQRQRLAQDIANSLAEQNSNSVKSEVTES